jgi:hypothetical protein
MSHTPAPWEVFEKLTSSENHRGYMIRAKYGRSMWAFADVQPGDEDGILGGANARLIAAAPELLEALQRLIGTGLDQATHHAIKSDPNHYVNVAIAKATGGK